MLFVPCLLGSVGKTATKGFSCIYSPELVCRSPNWPSRGNAWKRSILIPWGRDGKETGVVCSPWKPLGHGRWSHHVGQEPLAFLKRRWIKMASTVKEEWRRNQQWGSRAEPSDIRKFKLDTFHLHIFIFNSLYQPQKCKSRLGNMLLTHSYLNGGKNVMLFHNILMDLMDSVMLMLLFALFYETHRCIFL